MSQAEALLDDIVPVNETDAGYKPIVLEDTETGTNYELTVENGRLTMSKTSESGNSSIIIPAITDHIVIGTDRYIIIPEALKKIAVQHDHNIETVTFDCPRYWDEHDMSKMKIYINYLRPDDVKGSDLAKNVVVDGVDPDIMHFDWTITGHMTEFNGPITFLVCVQKVGSDGTTSNHWNSELSIGEMYVSPGLECEETVVAIYPGIITSLLTRMDEAEENLLTWMRETDTNLANWKTSTYKTLDDRMKVAEGNTTSEAILRRINECLDSNTTTQQVIYDSVTDYLTESTALSEEVTKQVAAYLDENLEEAAKDMINLTSLETIEKSGVVTPTVEGNVLIETISGDSYQAANPSPDSPQEIENVGVYDEASGKYAVEVKCSNADDSDESTITLYLDEPLRGIGEYKDSICQKDGVWGVNRNILKGVLDGTVSHGFNNNGVWHFDESSILNIFGVKIKPQAICNLFRVQHDSYQGVCKETNSNFNTLYLAGEVLKMGINAGLFATQDSNGFKAFFAENPMEIYAVAEEPTFTPFEDQTPFYNLMAFNEVTNVSIIDGSENTMPVATMRFPKYTDGGILLTDYAERKKKEIAVAVELERCFQSVSDGKALVASAITDKRVPTDATATFAKMAENIMKIVLGSGNATAGDVLAGKTFTNDDGVEYEGTLALSGTANPGQVLYGKTFYKKDPKNAVTGTMPNNGAVTQSLNAGGSYTIPPGYHNGSGKVTANSLANQTSATATAALITKGYTAWVNGVKITGTRPMGAKSLSGTYAPDWLRGKTVSDTIYFRSEFDTIPNISFVLSSATSLSNFSVSASSVTTKSFIITCVRHTNDMYYLTVNWSAIAT